MSCYLTFYGIPFKPKSKNENGDKKELNLDIDPIPIVSFSRNDNIFKYFDENLSIHFCYEERKYTDINGYDVDKVINDINNDIKSSEKRLLEYEKYASSNSDLVQEILTTKEYLEDLYRCLHYAEFINHIITEASFSYSTGFGKIVANMG